MADIRINALATTAASTASDDFVAVDGSANGTRKLNAYSPAFGGTLDVAGNVNLGTLAGGVAAKVTVGNGGGGNSALILRGGSPQTAFQIGSNINNANALEISPSTAAGGTTFTTTVWRIDGSGNTIQSGNLTVSGGVTAGADSTISGSGNTTLNIKTSDATKFASIVMGTTGTQPNQIFSGAESYGSFAGARSLNLAAYGPIAFYAQETSVGSYTERMRLNTTGNFLIGTTTDSSNGKLQLATHTTSAGGIGFGTDISVYRKSAAVLGCNGVADLFLETAGAGLWLGSAAGTYQVGINRSSNNLVFWTGSFTTALTLDSSQNATFAGKITANGAGSTFKGTATNDSAAAGYMGEYAETSTVYASRITLTTDTVANVASVSLTAGDWDVSGNVELEMSGVTSTDKRSGVSTTSASLTNNPDTCGVIDLPTTTLTGYLTIPTPTVRISIASTTTVYLPTKVTFSAGTTKAWGIIRARRVR